MPGPYELYLIRHGIAEEQGEAWPDDAKRPLTEEGISRVRKSARGLARLGVVFDAILTSPLVRTRQTADALASAFSVRPHIVAADSLAPGGTYQAVLADLEKHPRRSRIALVGHEPGIGELASRLSGARHPLQFKKGAACRIDVDALPPTGPGTLRWFLTSRIMRSIRK
jgi:phosphohistidine phosphatase